MKFSKEIPHPTPYPDCETCLSRASFSSNLIQLEDGAHLITGSASAYDVAELNKSKLHV